MLWQRHGSPRWRNPAGARGEQGCGFLGAMFCQWGHQHGDFARTEGPTIAQAYIQEAHEMTARSMALQNAQQMQMQGVVITPKHGTTAGAPLSIGRAAQQSRPRSQVPQPEASRLQGPFQFGVIGPTATQGYSPIPAAAAADPYQMSCQVTGSVPAYAAQRLHRSNLAETVQARREQLTAFEHGWPASYGPLSLTSQSVCHGCRRQSYALIVPA